MKDEKLFHELAADKEIFAAARDGYFSFYYSGNSIFEYQKAKGFTTHQKFALIFPDIPKYVKEAEAFKGKFSDDFAKDYRKIKTNVRLYRKEERASVNLIATNNSYKGHKPVVVLDIEKTIISDFRQIELDMVLLKGGSLRFVEAKLYSNSKELFSLNVFKKQIAEYEDCLRKNKDDLLTYYGQTVSKLNSLFNLQLQSPSHIEDKIVVLITKYEKVQWDHRLKSLLQNNELQGCLYYAVGDPAQCDIERLYHGKKCGAQEENLND